MGEFYISQSYDIEASSSLDASGEIEVTQSVLQNVSHSIEYGGSGPGVNYMASLSRDGDVFDGFAEIPNFHLTGDVDWTIEFWFSSSIKRDSYGANANGLISWGNSNSYRAIEFRFDKSPQRLYGKVNNTAVDNEGGNPLSSNNLNRWNHYAMCRSGSNVALYCSGTRAQYDTTGQAISDQTSSLRMGLHNGVTLGVGQGIGLWDELRITVGSCSHDPALTTCKIPTASFKEQLTSYDYGYYRFNISSSDRIVPNSASNPVFGPMQITQSNGDNVFASQSLFGSVIIDADPPITDLSESVSGGSPVTISMEYTPGEYSASAQVDITLDQFTVITSMSIQSGSDHTGSFDDVFRLRLSTDGDVWWHVNESGDIWTSSIGLPVTKSVPSAVTGSIIEDFLPTVWASDIACTKGLYIESTIISSDTSSRHSIDEQIFTFVTASRGATEVVAGTGVGRDIYLENLARAKKSGYQNR